MKEALSAVGIVILALGVGAGVFFSEQTRKTAPPPVASTAVVEVPFTELIHGIHATETRRANYLITSPDELTRLWRMVAPKATPPAIDFSAQSVIAVFAGQEPTLGYTITISKIEDAAERSVSITVQKPSPNCVEGQTVTTPFQIVAVPKTALPLTHEDIVATTSCAR